MREVTKQEALEIFKNGGNISAVPRSFVGYAVKVVCDVQIHAKSKFYVLVEDFVVPSGGLCQWEK